MDFHYYQNYHGPLMDAYEKSLIDVVQGAQALLASGRSGGVLVFLQSP